MKKLRVGVIGTGFIGKQHIEAIRRIPGAEVLAIADANGEMAKSVAESMCVPAYFTDYHSMLNDDAIDVVHNCTPSAMHYGINKDIILAGKGVYCEKPFTLTTDESEELVKLAAEKKVAAGVNFNYRHNAMVQEMRERLCNGSVGRPLMVSGEYLQDWLLYDTDFDWRLDPKLGGESRAVADIGSHCFDTAQFVLGCDIKRVYAKLMTMHPVRKRCEKNGTFSAGAGRVLEQVPVHSEDAAFIMAEFENGVPALFQVTQVCAGKKNGLALTVSASQAALEWAQERPDRLWIGRRDTPNEEVYADAKYLTGNAKAYASLPNGHPVGWHDALKNAIGAFYEAIREGSFAKPGSKRYTDFARGHQVMRLVDACLESSRTGDWVEVS